MVRVRALFIYKADFPPVIRQRPPGAAPVAVAVEPPVYKNFRPPSGRIRRPDSRFCPFYLHRRLCPAAALPNVHGLCGILPVLLQFDFYRQIEAVL